MDECMNMITLEIAYLAVSRPWFATLATTEIENCSVFSL